jgi:hypothetical protein
MAATWRWWATTIRSRPAKVTLQHDRIEHWTKNGAQLSDTVKRLLEKNPAPAPQPAGPVGVSVMNCCQRLFTARGGEPAGVYGGKRRMAPRRFGYHGLGGGMHETVD